MFKRLVCLSLLALLIAGCMPPLTGQEMKAAVEECASVGMGVTWYVQPFNDMQIRNYQCAPNEEE